MGDVEKQLDSIVWYKEKWAEPPVSDTAKKLLRQCAAVCPAAAEEVDLEDLIRRSQQFPVPFPIHTVRLQQLKSHAPPDRLKRNVMSTYAIVHERVVPLMANFLIHKRKYGSSIEQQLYRDMTVPQLIDRILLKRAITFMKAQDHYKLISGETGVDGWEAIGTSAEAAPLKLEACLSYDEMKLSALVYVSGYTECINDGARDNRGVPQPVGVEQEAVIIGVVGPRLKRVNRMEYEDMVVTEQQNRPENGYGPASGGDDAKASWRKMWDEFYQMPSVTHSALCRAVQPAPCWGPRVLSQRWARVPPGAFDNQLYCRRLLLIIDVALMEADARARERNKQAFLNVIGAGLGVWKLSAHQADVLVASVAARLRELLGAGRLRSVADVNLAHIQPTGPVAALFKPDTSVGDRNTKHPPLKLFLKDESHPCGGVALRVWSRSPSAALPGPLRTRLLLLTYPWDSNAHPGNEFWIGKLSSSGDPAAACSTQVAELHNAHINPRLRALRARVATTTTTHAGSGGVVALGEYCNKYT